MAVLSWLVAAAGLVLALFVFVTDGYLDGSVGYDRLEVVISLVLPFWTLSLISVIACVSGSLGSAWKCLPWILPSAALVALTVILVIIGCFPQA